MITNRAPFEYRYLSRRLLTEMAKNDKAQRRKLPKVVGNLGIPHVGSVQVSPREKNDEDLYELAAMSPTLTSKFTGNIETPRHYIIDELDMRHGVFETLGWPGGKISCYRGLTEAAENVYVILFGSASNIRGYVDNSIADGFCPSGVEGLYALLDAVRERTDPEIWSANVRVEGQMTEADRAEAAIRIALQGTKSDLGRHRFMARVYINCPSPLASLSGRVIVGAPLWIATPRVS